MMKNNLGNISFAVFLIFFGLIALLVSFGYITWSDLFNLFFRYWPVLIIIAGVKIVVGILPFGNYVNLAIDIVLNLVIVFILLFFKDSSSTFPNYFNWNASNTAVMKELSGFGIDGSKYDSKDIKERNYTFKIGASKFNLTSDDTVKDYITMTGKYDSTLFVPKLESDLNNGILNVNFKQDLMSKVMFRWFNNEVSTFNFEISQLKDIPTNLTIDLGAGEGNVNNMYANLQTVKTNVGAGKLTLDLNSVTKSVDISVGAGNVILVIPKGSKYSLSYSVGAGNVRVMDGETVTKSFGGLAAKGNYGSTDIDSLKITVNVGAGNVDIKES